MADALLKEDRPASRVGPNAVIQLAAALRDRLGKQATDELFTRAGQHRYLVDPPGDMVDERVAAGLFECLFADLPAATAAAVAAEAGRRTADYILANRIPGPAQTLLKSLPPTFSAPLLMAAIAKNAWTFAGSGRVRTGTISTRRPSWVIEIADNPLAMPGCAWHGAVFKRLFQVLVAGDASVRHPQCCHAGAPTCRFEIGRSSGAKSLL
ncbi:bacteriochlorophyll 4-vinyl reductase [Pelagibius sp.]|uniref:bacteriochlorophyll 4-vinyl reductase n=1 Tax=Pelagibius sp. TaxID=1931238 RepID=UPI003B505708